MIHTQIPLGNIKQVELRKIWKHEAINFTNWLALTENLELLSDEVNIEISLIGTEYNVGRFNVDIYAHEANEGKKIIIENQLERTDHDHLGKLITYASGLDAQIIIWIVKEVLEEHEKAINWLNDNTGEDLHFFAIKMEVWQIGNSAPAPKFHIIAKPNNWFKAVRQSVNKSILSETSQLQLKFWEAFSSYVFNKNIAINVRKPSPQHWMDISMGRSDAHLSLTINSQKNEFGCEVYIPDSKELFHLFHNNKEHIESELKKLTWIELPNKKASRIKLVRKGNFKNTEKWENFHSWMTEAALKFKEVFSKY